MNSLNKSLDAIAKPFLGITPWLLRLSLGISFFLHGYGKLPLPPQNLVKWFESEIDDWSYKPIDNTQYVSKKIVEEYTNYVRNN